MATDNELNVLCDNIVKVMKRDNLNDRQMADIMQIGVKSLQKIKNGIIPKRVSIKIIFLLAKYLSVEPYKLFYPI